MLYTQVFFKTKTSSIFCRNHVCPDLSLFNKRQHWSRERAERCATDCKKLKPLASIKRSSYFSVLRQMFYDKMSCRTDDVCLKQSNDHFYKCWKHDNMFGIIFFSSGHFWEQSHWFFCANIKTDKQWTENHYNSIFKSGGKDTLSHIITGQERTIKIGHTL